MLKKIFSKVNNFIQWTKKWHFFHLIFVGPLTLFVTYCIVVTTIFTIYPPVPDTNAVECDIGGTFWDGCVVYIVFLFVFLLFFTSFIQLIVWIMSKIQKKNLLYKKQFFITQQVL